MTVRANAAALPCAICGRPAAEPFRPFCSRRCSELDLQHWLTGRYTVPVADGEEEDEVPRAGPDRGEDD